MSWRLIHRWLGLGAGFVALLLGITGAILAIDPARDAWQSVPAQAGLPVSTLVQRVSSTISGIEEIRRLPSGDIVVYSFDGDQARAVRVDPTDGRVLGDYQTSAFSRWVKNLHRSFLLDDMGRMAAAGVAFSMLFIAISGSILTARRMGGWRKLASRVRGTPLQRLHVMTGRVLVAVLALSSITALYMSATTFELIPIEADQYPDVISLASEAPEMPGESLPLLQELRIESFRKLNFPTLEDPDDTWKVTTSAGEGWIDRRSGETLAWEPALASQRIYDWVMILHTGEGAWAWGLVLGVAAASIPLFWISGLILWWQVRSQTPKVTNNSVASQADTLIFVASESGTTWGFALALHQALVQNGHRVHTNALENFQASSSAKQIFVFAATYGDGQAPAHAAHALERISREPVGTAPVTVLGFGDRQFSAFCSFAEEIDRVLRTKGWPQLLPLERIHQQSAQQFALWGEALAHTLGEALTLDYVPRVPRTTALELIARQDYPGAAGEPTTILRFQWATPSWRDRLTGRALSHFEAGDLVGILPPTSAVPRYYSLSSSYKNGFLEICVRRFSDGVCSSYLHSLKIGDTIQAFIKANPGFALEGSRRPAVLIGAGTGVAPLVGFIRNNDRCNPMFLYYGSRDPAKDFYFDQELQGWLRDRHLTRLQTTFSRVPNGGGYVQNLLDQDADHLRKLISDGAIVRVCGSRPMAQSVVQELDKILSTANLSVQQLRTEGRYAEDVF